MPPPRPRAISASTNGPSSALAGIHHGSGSWFSSMITVRQRTKVPSEAALAAPVPVSLD